MHRNHNSCLQNKTISNSVVLAYSQFDSTLIFLLSVIEIYYGKLEKTRQPRLDWKWCEATHTRNDIV